MNLNSRIVDALLAAAKPFRFGLPRNVFAVEHDYDFRRTTVNAHAVSSCSTITFSGQWPGVPKRWAFIRSSSWMRALCSEGNLIFINLIFWNVVKSADGLCCSVLLDGLKTVESGRARTTARHFFLERYGNSNGSCRTERKPTWVKCQNLGGFSSRCRSIKKVFVGNLPTFPKCPF